MLATLLLAMHWWVVPIASKIQQQVETKTLEEEVQDEFLRVVNELSEKGLETWV